MKSLKEGLLNKKNINNITVDQGLKEFCDALNIKYDKKVKELYNYFLNGCSDILHGIDLEDNGLRMFCSNFELFLMIAVMLKDDKRDADDILELGFKSYRGNADPSNFSWFEPEDKDGDNILDIIRRLYRNNKDISDGFKKFFNLVKLYCKDTSDYEVWNFYDNTNDCLEWT